MARKQFPYAVAGAPPSGLYRKWPAGTVFTDDTTDSGGVYWPALVDAQSSPADPMQPAWSKPLGPYEGPADGVNSVS
jgi:hypothetical protein